MRFERAPRAASAREARADGRAELERVPGAGRADDDPAVPLEDEAVVVGVGVEAGLDLDRLRLGERERAARPLGDLVDDRLVGAAFLVRIGRDPRLVVADLEPVDRVVDRVEAVQVVDHRHGRRHRRLALEAEEEDGLAGLDDLELDPGLGEQRSRPGSGGDDDRLRIEVVERRDRRLVEDAAASLLDAGLERGQRAVGEHVAGLGLEHPHEALRRAKVEPAPELVPVEDLGLDAFERRAPPASSPRGRPRARRSRGNRAASRRSLPRARASLRAPPGRGAPIPPPGRPAGRSASARGSSPARARPRTARTRPRRARHARAPRPSPAR